MGDLSKLAEAGRGGSPFQCVDVAPQIVQRSLISRRVFEGAQSFADADQKFLSFRAEDFCQIGRDRIGGATRNRVEPGMQGFHLMAQFHGAIVFIAQFTKHRECFLNQRQVARRNFNFVVHHAVEHELQAFCKLTRLHQTDRSRGSFQSMDRPARIDEFYLIHRIGSQFAEGEPRLRQKLGRFFVEDPSQIGR